jgi:hypothetical protein
MVAAAITLPNTVLAQEGGSAPAGGEASAALPIEASQDALALFLADPAGFLSQPGDLSVLIASVALADPSVVEQIASVAAAEGAPEGAAAAVARGLVSAATVAASDSGVSSEQVVAMASAAMRTDASAADRVAALARSSGSNLSAAISQEMVSITQNAISGNATPEVITALVKATAVANPQSAQELVTAAEATNLGVAAAVGRGLGQASTQLTSLRDIRGASDVTIVAAESSSDIAGGFVTGTGDVLTADIPTPTAPSTPVSTLQDDGGAGAAGDAGDAGSIGGGDDAGTIGGPGSTPAGTAVGTVGDTTGTSGADANGASSGGSGGSASGGGSTSGSSSPTG